MATSPDILLLSTSGIDFAAALQSRLPEIAVREAVSLAAARDMIPEAEIFLTFGSALRQDLFVHARRLRWVHSLGTGVDGIIDKPGLAQEVVVTTSRGIHGPAVSEMVLMSMLALARGLPRMIANQRMAAWEPFGGALLHGKTVGLVGVGSIAEALAPRCKAMGMHVVGISRTPRKIPGIDHMAGYEAITAEIPTFDFLVVLTPLVPETRGLIGREILAQLKPSAFLVNVARGAVVDEVALVEALRDNCIGGAALDAFIDEPLPSDHPLWQLPNAIITPHVAGNHEGYAADVATLFAANYRHFQRGELLAMKGRQRRGS